MHVFPQGLDNSLLIAVLAGVLIRLFFTESLGWVFSGLVVPGYLAAVAVVRPSAVAVIVVEANATFALVRAASWALGAARLGTPVFGRERFVWLVVASVGVRLLLEGLLAPDLSRWALDVRWDPTDGFGFYGIGLVLVPLVANAMWKPGLTSGAFQLSVVTVLSFGAIRLLAATTNYSLAQLALSFDRVALDFAASPKAYLLLLGGLVLASRGSLRFGWDTSGVLIPGLLTLGAFTPTRVIGALGEAVAVASLATLAVRLPRLREWNIEGPRRVVFVFTLGCLFKYGVCWAAQGLSWRLGDDPWGIGYLLPSLLATRMWQRKDVFVVLVPAVAVPVAALAVISVVGFGLKQLPAPEAELGDTADQAPSACEEGTRWSSWPVRAALLLPAAPGRAAPVLREGDLREFGALLGRMRSHPGRGCSQLLEERRLAQALGLRVDRAIDSDGGGWSVVSEAGPDPARIRGLGVALLSDRAAMGGLVLGQLEINSAWGRPELLEPLALQSQAQGLVLLTHPKGRSERADPIQVWRAAAGALGAEGMLVKEAATASLGLLAPGWLRARLESVLGRLGSGTHEEGVPVLGLDPSALERLAPRPGALGPVTLWAGSPPTPGVGKLLDDPITLAAIEHWLSASDSAAKDAEAAALGLSSRRDPRGRSLLYPLEQGSSAIVARQVPGEEDGIVEVAGGDRRLVAFGETLRHRLGLKWLLVAPESQAASPFAQAVRRKGLLNAGPIVTVHPFTGAAMVSCVEAAASAERCDAVVRIAAQAGVTLARQPPYSDRAPGAPSRAGAFGRATGSAEVGVWVPPASLVGPSLPTPSELSLFERAGFLTRRVAVAGELATRCRQLTGSGPVDWRPLALFRQTHQAQLLADQALALKQAGCPPELWLDSDEGLAFAACSSGSKLSLEAIEEGHGEETFRCGAGLEAPLDPRPTRLQVLP